MSLDPTEYRAACELLDLPVAVYVVEADDPGTILYANTEFKKLFGDDVVGKSMADLYPDPDIRKVLYEKLDRAESQGDHGLRQEVLHLEGLRGELAVKDFSRSIRDDKHRRTGLMCCMIEYGNEDRSLRLFRHLPAGIYELDADDRLVFGNQRLAELHGFSTFDELKGRLVREFYAEQGEADTIRNEIDEEGFLIDRRIEMLKSDGTTFFASVTAVPIKGPSGEYVGREGTIIDVTREERYRRLIDSMPIALFELRQREDGSEEIVDCNETFARINGFARAADLIDHSIAELHISGESYKRLLARMNNEEETFGAPLIGYTLPIKTKNGSQREVEVSSRFLRDRNGKIVGRVGAGRDVTEEQEIREWQDLLTGDIGNLLHSYSSSLMSLRHTLDVAIDLAGEDPFGDSARAGALQAAVEHFEPARGDLISSLSELLSRRGDPHAARAWSAETWDEATKLRDLLATKSGDLPPELRYATLRQAAAAVLKLLAELEGGYLPREPERAARRAAGTLQRLGTLLALRLARTKLLELGTELRGLREVITTRGRTAEEKTSVRFEEVVRSAIAEHAEYAQAKNIRIRVHFDEAARQATIHGAQRNLNRAVANLVHNAVKYSWHRDEGVYVDLQAFVDQDEHRVVLEIENFGVPIPDDERELVFSIGFRGRLSGDRRRAGTGIGLWDARRVARAHSGDVTIESVSASSGSHSSDFRSPFLTTATLWLPLADPRS